VYLVGLFSFCIGSVGIARAQTVSQLMTSRVLQALGSSCGSSLGPGVIGDIYKVEKRGTIVGVFQAVSSLILPPNGRHSVSSCL
jgi:MFS family permease